MRAGLGAAVVAAALPVLLLAPPAVAGTVAEVPVPVADALPPTLGALMVRAAGADELVLVNPTAEPLEVLAPGGAPFLRLSAAGVETDAAVPFTYLSRFGDGVAVTLPPGVVDGAPPRWTTVSDDVSWRWHDPRLRPALTGAPVGGRADAREVLARWVVPVRHGGVAATIEGTVERRPGAGAFRAVADPAPGGVGAVLPGGNRVVLTATGPLTVLGIAGEDFLRRTGTGWEVALESPTHRLDLIAAGRPVPAGSGWRPVAGPGPVSWSDPRLAVPADAALSADVVARWHIPLRTADGPAALTGALRYVPAAATGPVVTVPLLLAAVLALAVLLAGLAARIRRLG